MGVGENNRVRTSQTNDLIKAMRKWKKKIIEINFSEL